MSRVSIAEASMTLEHGESTRAVCPFCGGGTSEERSLSIKRDEETGLVLYHCFRANCGKSGVLGGSRVIRITPTTPRPDTFTPWKVDGFMLIQDAPQWAHDQLQEWGIPLYSAHARHWKYDGWEGRIAMPYHGARGELNGYILRRYKNSTGPKVLTARITENCVVAFLYETEGMITERPLLFAVEDLPSATRLHMRGHNAVALLGTTPSVAAMEEIQFAANKVLGGATVIFALDPDATAQAIRLQKKYGMRGASSVGILPKDVKNMTKEELDGWLLNVT